MDEATTLSERFARMCRWSPARFCGPQEGTWEEAERNLGVPLPGPFMALVDAVRIQRAEIEDICERKADPVFDDWPDHLLPFFYDAAGNCYAFDTRTTSANSDHPVVFRDCETASVEQSDASFSDWVNRYVEDIPGAGPARFGSPLVAVACMLLACIVVVIASVGIGVVIDWLTGR